MNTIGNTIAKLRKHAAMTQEELAVKIGVSAQSISKWETGTHMPDILLLPIIAEVFDVSIDFLFGKESHTTVPPIPQNDFPTAAYEELLYTLHRGFIDQDISSDVLRARAAETAHYLSTHPDSQMAILKNGEQSGVYVNKDLGIIWKNNDNDSLKLLEDDCVGDVLSVFANEHTRRIMLYQLQHPTMSFTAASIAAKHQSDLRVIQTALEKLVQYGFTSRLTVDLGTETLDVFHLFAPHKMVLVYTMLSLAQRLAGFRECYQGFRN